MSRLGTVEPSEESKRKERCEWEGKSGLERRELMRSMYDNLYSVE